MGVMPEKVRTNDFERTQAAQPSTAAERLCASHARLPNPTQHTFGWLTTGGSTGF